MRYLSVSPELAYLAVFGPYNFHPPSALLRSAKEKGVYTDAQRNRVIDYSLLNLGPGFIEHDVSISRQDREVGDPIRADPALLKQFLSFRPPGSSYAITDTAVYRKKRYAQQAMSNKSMKYGLVEHSIVAGETTGLHNIFGQGWNYEIPQSWLKALFVEERLPIEEGWRVRSFPFTVIEGWLVWIFVFIFAWPFTSMRELWQGSAKSAVRESKLSRIVHSF